MKHRPPLSPALSRMRIILIYVKLTATSPDAIEPASPIAFLLFDITLVASLPHGPRTR